LKEGFIKSFDKEDIYRYLWDDVKNPKGVVQIFHGMAEHAKRYDDFAKFLNKNGFIVFADDHRGHGQTAKGVENLGKYHGKDIVWDTILDEMYFSRLLKEQYKLPLYVFAHSYGSFICQAYIEKCKYYDKAIICGSACMKNSFSVFLARQIAKITIRHKGKDAPAKLIEKLSFGAYDKKTKNGSWLNSDDSEVEKYYKDEYCGQTMSAKFYLSFFSMFQWLYKPEFLREINPNKPIYLIAGKDDYVGNKGKLVQKLFKMYANLDIKGLKMSLYEGARHEILNEKIKQKVYNDVLNFINEKV